MTKNKSDTRKATRYILYRSPQSSQIWEILGDKIMGRWKQWRHKHGRGSKGKTAVHSRPRSKCKLRIFRKLTRVALLFFGVGYLCLKNLRMSILHRSLNQIWDFCSSWRKLLRWSIDEKRRLLGVSITGLVGSRVELRVWICDCVRLLLCPMQYHEHIYIKPVKTVTIKLVLLLILRNLW